MRKKKLKPIRLSAGIAAKVLEVVDAGLVSGIGRAEPGSMCVEAAVCYAMGEPHGDMPRCVLSAIRNLKIAINDDDVWITNYGDDDGSKAVRSEALRRLAIAQLGSAKGVKREKWDAAIKAYVMTGPVYKAWVKDAAWRKKEALKNLANVQKAIKNDEYVDQSIYYTPACNFSFDDDMLLSNMGANTPAKAKKVCEDIVQILIKLKSPGTKYLYLTEGGKKPKAKKRLINVTKKRVIKRHK